MEDDEITEQQIVQWMKFCSSSWNSDGYWGYGIQDFSPPSDYRMFKRACDHNDPKALAKLERFVVWKIKGGSHERR